MKKNQIVILILIITSALLGLIFFQFYWINKVIEIHERQFGYRVNHALVAMAKSLQEEETVYYIVKEINSVDIDSNLIRCPKKLNDSIGYFLNQTNKIRNSNFNLGLSKSDSLVIKNDKFINRGDNIVTRKNLQERYISKVQDKIVFIEKIIDKLISHNPRIEERIDTSKLYDNIATQLKKKSINLPFEYCVRNSEGKIIHASIEYIDSPRNKVFSIDLFPDDLLSKHNRLDVYFPNKASFLLQSMGLMAFSSMLLTLIIIIIFTITIWIILRQKKVSEIKNDFISNMTHELKTPISTISLASQMLNDKNIPEQQKNHSQLATIIQEEIKRLTYQVERVLQMAVFDRTHLKLKIKKINIHNLIHNTAKHFDLQISQRNGRINLLLQADNAIVEGDEMHLNNLLVNLVDNALKYSVGEPEISIVTRNLREGIFISVKDNGIGISKEHQKKIFEKFYRVPTGNVHNVKGFGLGLSYVRTIVSEHKGSITVESEVNQGTEFKIFLPEIHKEY